MWGDILCKKGQRFADGLSLGHLVSADYLKFSVHIFQIRFRYRYAKKCRLSADSDTDTMDRGITTHAFISMQG